MREAGCFSLESSLAEKELTAPPAGPERVYQVACLTESAALGDQARQRDLPVQPQ